MIVDDSASLRIVLKMTLTAEGHEVIEAKDGQDALSKLDGRLIHLIISDLNMPVMNDFDFARAAKANPFYKFTPILMLTTETTEEKKMMGKAAGVNGWMLKPFAPASILKAIEKLAK